MGTSNATAAAAAATFLGASLLLGAALMLRRRASAPASSSLAPGDAAAADAAAAAAACGDAVAIARQAPGTLLYTHGGHMGAALALLRDARWLARLRRLAPVTAARLAPLLAQLPRAAPDAALLLENNAVLAAFGTARCGLRPAPVMEWDTFLLAADCARVDAAAAAGDARALRAAGAALARGALVTHGTLGSVARELLLGRPQYATLRAGGAQTAPEWLQVYAQALAEAAADEGLGAGAGGAAAAPASTASGPAPALLVFLDVKSPSASPAVLDALVSALNDLGVCVWGVGAFCHAQLRGLVAAPAPQRVRAATLAEAAARAARDGAEEENDKEEHAAAEGAASVPAPAPLAMFLCASLGDVQRAALGARPSVPAGAAVLFNGGSMLRAAGSPGGVAWELDPAALAAARHLAAAPRGLRLGAYVAEPSLDPRAADALVRAFNEHAAVLPLGLSYSGLPGLAEPAFPRGRGFEPLPWPLSALIKMRTPHSAPPAAEAAE